MYSDAVPPEAGLFMRARHSCWLVGRAFHSPVGYVVVLAHCDALVAENSMQPRTDMRWLPEPVEVPQAKIGRAHV